MDKKTAINKLLKLAQEAVLLADSSERCILDGEGRAICNRLWSEFKALRDEFKKMGYGGK